MQYVQLNKQDQADVAEEVLAEFDRCETIIRNQMTALIDAGLLEEELKCAKLN